MGRNRETAPPLGERIEPDGTAQAVPVRTEAPQHLGPSAAWDQGAAAQQIPDPHFVSNTALIAWHGMGQQLRFETVDLVARALAAAEASRNAGAAPRVTTRLVELGQQKLWRAELDLADGRGAQHRVHVYEAYWAPYTQGRITLAETVHFLFAAGYNGVRYGFLPPFLLCRYLFGRRVAFSLRRDLTLLYLTLLATVASLAFINVVATVLVTIKLLTGPGDAVAWPSYALLGDVTIDLAALASVFGATGAAFWIAYRRHLFHQQHMTSSEPRTVVQLIMWALLIASIVVSLAAAVLIGYHLIVHLYWNEPARAWPASVAGLLARWQSSVRDLPLVVVVLGVATWLLVFGGSAAIRWFLLEFVGDSAIYVSSHKLNRFDETRQRIRESSMDVSRAIYQFGGYTSHILIGHSLGSVVAYDTLNGLLVDDNLSGGHLRVAERTALLLTFGSILDRTAFLFRTQATESDVREALASAGQPLISNAAARPRWRNIYSPQDMFGGRLDYYDVENGTTEPPVSNVPTPPPIENVVDKQAWIPLLAHDQYWSNPLFANTLADTITTLPIPPLEADGTRDELPINRRDPDRASDR